jgi:O-antigen/teichoic acid export membrane protein
VKSSFEKGQDSLETSASVEACHTCAGIQAIELACEFDAKQAAIGFNPATSLLRGTFSRRAWQALGLFRDQSSLSAARIAAGIAVGQLASLAAGPLLTRLYSVDEFGKFGTLWAVGTVVSSIACLRFEGMVVLPGTDEDAAGSGIAGLIICVLLTAASSLLCWGALPFIQGVAKLREITPYLWSIPIFVLTCGLYLMGTNWALRKGRIPRVANSRAVQGTTTSLVQVVLGIAWRSAGGLLGGAAAGNGISGCWLCARAALEDTELRRVTFKSIRGVVRRHMKSALELSGATLLNNASLYTPMAALTLVYGTTVSGHFGLGLRMATAPFALIGTALGQSFLSEASLIVRSDKAGLPRSLKHTTLRLLLTGVPAVGLLALIAPWLFGRVFGAQWTEAGVYLRLLAPGLLAQFVVAPISSIVLVLQTQRMFAIWEATRLSLLIAIFTAALHTWIEPRVTVFLIGSINAVLYTWLGFRLWRDQAKFQEALGDPHGR